ncbi:hypothetical protein A0H81_09283 [Grifola frondosa]|uniref:HIT-type domain-containing protein n=1 Tax=Grifola frondosa TaxID=5627 RepID=A0A1C7M1G2_GRIFR|nr:hypothetical protein A0H81_09283 [Grifola frondosa]
MPPAKRAQCQVCHTNESKYTCARCTLIYCSVPCYKVHKETCEPRKSTVDSKPMAPVLGEATAVEKQTDDDESQARSIASNGKSEQANQADSISPKAPLRSLASLKWPYIPEESAYPDPLKRDDPKPLQLHQYEVMASSTAIRRTLASHPQLPELLVPSTNYEVPNGRKHLNKLSAFVPEAVLVLQVISPKIFELLENWRKQ